LKLTKELSVHGHRIEVLAKIAPQMAKTLQGATVDEVLAIVGSEHQELKQWLHQLVELGYPPEQLAAEAGEITSIEWRVKALARLVDDISTHKLHKVHTLWHECLHLLASRTRGELLASICKLAPVINVLGGTVAVQRTLQAIQDIVRWWP